MKKKRLMKKRRPFNPEALTEGAKITIGNDSCFFIKLTDGSYAKYFNNDAVNLYSRHDNSKYGCILCAQHDENYVANLKSAPKISKKNLSILMHLNKHTRVYYRREIFKNGQSNFLIILFLCCFNQFFTIYFRARNCP